MLDMKSNADSIELEEELCDAEEKDQPEGHRHGKRQVRNARMFSDTSLERVEVSKKRPYINHMLLNQLVIDMTIIMLSLLCICNLVAVFFPVFMNNQLISIPFSVLSLIRRPSVKHYHDNNFY